MVEKPSSGDQAAAEAAADSASEAQDRGEPIVPIFGLNLPKLPTVERALEEQRFMSEGLAGFPRQERTWADVREKVQAALGKFDERETFEDAPLEAVRQLGLIALRPDRFEDLPPWQPRPGSKSPIDEILRDLHGLRRLVWSAVEAWQKAAIWAPSLEGRQQALDRLRKFTGLLVPDTRGRRRQLGPPPEILQLGYRQLLFRLNRARQLLDEAALEGQVPRSSLDDVARESGLLEEWIRDWLFFSDRLERKARAQTAERMAQELLAGIAGMDADSIATVISRGRRARSRKGTAS